MRYHRVLPLLVLLLITACSGMITPTPKPVDVDKVERVTVYSGGNEEVIQPHDERFAGLAKHLLATLSDLNLPAGCIFSEDEIAVMKREGKPAENLAIELLLKAPETITIRQWIEEEDRDHILTDEWGFRMLETETTLFVLSGEYRGHFFFPSEGKPPTWGCWAIEREAENLAKEIDTRWIEGIEKALEE